MSDHDTYVIRVSPEGWSLLLNGQDIGAFAQREEAQQAALIGAEVSRQNHRPVQVFVQEAGGDVQLITRTQTGLAGELVFEPETVPSRGAGNLL
jgi:hypothetical protein